MNPIGYISTTVSDKCERIHRLGGSDLARAIREPERKDTLSQGRGKKKYVEQSAVHFWDGHLNVFDPDVSTGGSYTAYNASHEMAMSSTALQCFQQWIHGKGRQPTSVFRSFDPYRTGFIGYGDLKDGLSQQV